MRLERVEADGVKATIGTRRVRTQAIEGEYTEVLNRRYDVYSLLTETLALRTPRQVKRTNESGIEETVNDPDDLNRYYLEMAQVSQKHPRAKTHTDLIGVFVRRAARIKDASGAFEADNGYIDEDNLVKAYEHFLEAETSETGEILGFWGDVLAKIVLLDTPTAPLEQRPQEALTAEQQADPLLTRQIGNGKRAPTPAISTTPDGG